MKPDLSGIFTLNTILLLFYILYFQFHLLGYGSCALSECSQGCEHTPSPYVLLHCKHLYDPYGWYLICLENQMYDTQTFNSVSVGQHPSHEI